MREKLTYTQVKKLIEGKRVIGVDEVGRGVLAGPLVVGAVLIDQDIYGIRDSKQVKKEHRLNMAERVKARAIAYGLGWVSSQKVDELGLTRATTKAVEEAVKSMPDYDYILMDGVYNYLPDNDKVIVFPKADQLFSAVSSASIIAKVARDDYMAELALEYPGYGFEDHVGYSTLAHRQAIEDQGLCDQHRRLCKPIAAIQAMQESAQAKAT